MDLVHMDAGDLFAFKLTGEHPLRALVDLTTGATIWALFDLCELLGITNVTQAKKRLRPEQLTTARLTAEGSAGNPNSIMVTESGMWRLVLTSRTPLGRLLEEQITGEVLPAIRREGGYLTAQKQARIIEALDVADEFAAYARRAYWRGDPISADRYLVDGAAFVAGELDGLIDRTPKQWLEPAEIAEIDTARQRLREREWEAVTA